MLERLYILIEAFAVLYFLHQLYGEKIKIDFYTITFFVVDFALMESINAGIIPGVCNYIIYPFVVAFCKKKFSCNIGNAIVNTSLCLIILGSIQFLSYTIAFSLSWFQLSIRIQAFVINIMTLVFSFIISSIINLHKLSFYMQKKEVILKVVILIGIAVIGVSVFKVRFTKGLLIELGIWICIAISAFIIVLSAYEMYKVHYFEEKYAFEVYKKYEQTYTAMIDEIRIRQHDLKNHINVIYMQHNLCNTYEELVDMQKKNCDEIVFDNRYCSLLKISDSTFAGFVYCKFKEAEKEGIKVEFYIETYDIKTNVPIYRLVEIVGNLMNNAIEALKNENEKRMYFSIKSDDDFVYIEIRNVYRQLTLGEINCMFDKNVSTKGKENSGLGLYSVKKLSDEYDFRVRCSNKMVCEINWICFELCFNKYR